MYDINDTICAISSAPVLDGVAGKSIIRVSGAEAFGVLKEIFDGQVEINGRGITSGRIFLEEGVEIEAVLYSFLGPYSYTGEDLFEIHVFAPAVIVREVLSRLLERLRGAEPGEFTLRAYLNGKMDLSQAEAVAEIVASSNKFQLAAAETLLAGALCETVEVIRQELLDIMSMIEAGMDFSTEGIEFVTSKKAVETIAAIRIRLEGLLAGSIRYEEMIDLPAVGIAGAANAGKSSLLNALLGQNRSIVSSERATTRDVLTGMLELDRCNCALFDCAGLSLENDRANILDGLAQQAAVEALNGAPLVLFCVDVNKDDYVEDVAIAGLLHPGEFVLVATKCDLAGEEQLGKKLAELNRLFAAECLTTSAYNDEGLEHLREVIDDAIIRLRSKSTEAAEKIAITERHRLAVQEAIKNLVEAAEEMAAGKDEVAAMLLRSGYQELSGLEREDIDEVVLDRIFSNFCIGK